MITLSTLRIAGALFLALSVMAACQSKESPDLINLSPRDFAAQIAAKGDSVLLVDVRTPGEFQGGHIPGALLLDFQGADFAAEVAKLPKGKQVYVYCRSGRRSEASVPVFLAAGFRPIRNLEDGIVGWESWKRESSKP